MAMFALSALIGTPLGPLVFSWTGNKASWRWIDWAMVSWNPHLEKEKKKLYLHQSQISLLFTFCTAH